MAKYRKLETSPSFELADRLVRIIQDGKVSAGLPLQIFGTPHTPATQGVVDLGLCYSAADARNVAAAHFAGTDNGSWFQEAHTQLLLRLDVQGEPIFGATLPVACPRPQEFWRGYQSQR